MGEVAELGIGAEKRLKKSFDQSDGFFSLFGEGEKQRENEGKRKNWLFFPPPPRPLTDYIRFLFFSLREPTP